MKVASGLSWGRQSCLQAGFQPASCGQRMLDRLPHVWG